MYSAADVLPARRQLQGVCPAVSPARLLSISRYEAGKRLPNYDQLNAIAAALGVEWEELVPVDAKGAVIAAHVIKKAGLKLVSKDDGEVKHPPTPRERIDAAFERLNDDGKEKAAESVEIIAGNPKYQRLARKDTPVAAPLPGSTENGE